MAYAVMSRKFLQYENEVSVERMEICVDTAADLPESIPGCKIAQGSIAWDISTGDFYGMASTGDWVSQSGGASAQTLEMPDMLCPVGTEDESEVAVDDTVADLTGAETGTE